jgi:hypothetical protein
MPGNGVDLQRGRIQMMATAHRSPPFGGGKIRSISVVKGSWIKVAGGTLYYAGIDWADPQLGRRSMKLMAEEVMPRVNAAIAKG